ncbi:MAG: glycoside hydrolase family 3 C-terminal domain-containing protein, partial [Clostridia bacterium]|nr:glycoside hydrolase family 3 C-terminal domain-containing protein [Clostridia bacterium]
PDAAQKLIRCEEHRKLALEAARETIILLKNEGILPLERSKIKKIGVFGKSADLIPIGSNYSGPYKAPWQGEDAPTPLEALRAYTGDSTEIIFAGSDEIESVAPGCDICFYFTSILEGEGSDRSDLRLPSVTEHKNREDDSGLIVDLSEQIIEDNQEESIIRLCRANRNTVVILLNGAPVDMTPWIAGAPAVIEAWYPGEQGAKALTEILFGEINPSAKLPVTIPKSAGQLPLFYSYKPSGRGYAYCDNDGRPLYPFGYGMSYTSFVISGAEISAGSDGVMVSFEIENTGKYDGTETVQLYIGSHHCDVVRPIKELKAYKRIKLKAGETKKESITLERSAFGYYNRSMEYGLHDGCHTIMLGTSSEDIAVSFELTVKGGIIAEV